MRQMRTLSLNNAFLPIRLGSGYDAIGRFYCGTCVAGVMEKDTNFVQFYNWDEWMKRSQEDVWPEDQWFLQSSHGRVAMPRVIRFLNYDKIPKPKSFKPTRRLIYNRDDHRCYLCGKHFKDEDLTIDHMIPKSKGGRNTWTNLVTCCFKCNHAKGDKTLQEIKMTPKFLPQDMKRSNILSIKMDAGGVSAPEWEYFGI
jgi:hypothetical protein